MNNNRNEGNFRSGGLGQSSMMKALVHPSQGNSFLKKEPRNPMSREQEVAEMVRRDMAREELASRIPAFNTQHAIATGNADNFRIWMGGADAQ